MDRALVGIVVGSDSDLPAIAESVRTLEMLGIRYELTIASAHRSPDRVLEYARTARTRGLKVIIAAAGLAAHLPGFIAANTVLPVIGVPMGVGALNGVDALLSIVQMPPGIPVACVGISAARNAAMLAAAILATGDEVLAAKLETVRRAMAEEVAAKAKRLGKVEERDQ
ncbi:MAG TPA: 5-(carboxyamino)imidazole ribonucleotide mutase [Firmicutes bacterium]|nr:5-(carboxyamino)imidazole ribonucleotide mutase [Bacillota bacterium]